jgi:nitric oxide reductase NorD protein
MELDEIIYSKVLQFFKKNKKVSQEEQSRTVVLNDIKPRLTILARAITGESIEIFPAEREGGYRNNNFFLPISFSTFSDYESNLSYYFFRILYLSVQQKKDFNWSGNAEYNTMVSQQKALETAPNVLLELFEEYPISFHLHTYFYSHFSTSKDADYTWIYGKWMRNKNRSIS